MSKEYEDYPCECNHSNFCKRCYLENLYNNKYKKSKKFNLNSHEDGLNNKATLYIEDDGCLHIIDYTLRDERIKIMLYPKQAKKLIKIITNIK